MRVSCHTIAFITGSPVLRSHTTAVSRWLVMPSAAMSSPAGAGLLDRLVDHLLAARPDLLRIVLDPARLGIDLLVLLLRHRDDLARVVEDHRPRAGRPLIQCN